MKTKRKAEITSVSSGKISPASAQPLHATKPLVDVDDLTVQFGAEPILENISFCIHPGECIGLIGPNGAGKTTLLRAMLGLLPQSKGVVRREQTPVGYIPQRGTLYNSMVPISVLEVVRLGAGDPAAAIKALETVRLAHLAHHRFTELSGGQQQRVILAKALSGGADLLILDEPTTGIDEQAQTAFYELLRSLQQQGTTIVMVSHEVDTVLKLVTRVICLNRTIVYDGPPEHFEADTYMPRTYAKQHMQLHHRHGVGHA